MTWSAQRKALIIFVLLVVGIIILIPLILWLYPEASCSDGKINQDERGVDCGGICSARCSQDIFPLSILWSRAFKVAPGVYNMVAYVSNPNLELGAKRVPFTFSLYDERNILIVKKQSIALVPPGQDFPIFVGGIGTGEKNISRALISFDAEPEWQETPRLKDFEILEYSLNEGPSPYIDVKVRNGGVETKRNIVLVVVLFDKGDNAIAASQTFIENLLAEEETTTTLTWREAFPSEISRVEIYPLVP